MGEKIKINKELIEHVAEVARLKLSEKEIKKFLPQLKEVLEAFSKLDKANTANVESSFQPVELKDSLRDDKVGECLSQEKALSLTEHKKDGYFKGPRAV
jgi:aspartyl-tRNA(Asn)/glutamyl-tRNA(Gln) amidotransferase subunit C|tara:strand:+ start:89 stop:385 length:297 start_codon:yes stop_codon:yes gene_type:complete